MSITNKKECKKSRDFFSIREFFTLMIGLVSGTVVWSLENFYFFFVACMCILIILVGAIPEGIAIFIINVLYYHIFQELERIDRTKR